MDVVAALGLLLCSIAVAVTVTPGIANRWVAAVAWLFTAIYAAWMFGAHWQGTQTFFRENRSLVVLWSGGLVLIALWRARQEQRRKAEASRALEAERQRQFDSFPADLGTIDHGVKSVESIPRMLAALKDARPAASRIFEYLFRDLPKLLPEPNDPENSNKKQALYRQAAVQLRDDVLLLEDCAARAQAEVQTFMTSGRVMLALAMKQLNPATKRAWIEVKGQWTRAAETMRQFSALLISNGEGIRKLEGHQQDLTRVAHRTTKAMQKMAAASDTFADYLTDEAVPLLAKHLGN